MMDFGDYLPSSYDDLLQLYKLYVDRCRELEEDNAKKEELMERIKSVSRAACNEYYALRARLNAESEASSQVIKTASKWYKENRVLKRRSTILMQKVAQLQAFDIGDIDTQSEQTDTDQEEESDSNDDPYRKLMEEMGTLKDKIALYETTIRDLEEEVRLWKSQFDRERFEHMDTVRQLEAEKLTNSQFRRVSALAVEQYQNLEGMLEVERRLNMERSFSEEVYEEIDRTNVEVCPFYEPMDKIKSCKQPIKDMDEIAVSASFIRESPTRLKQEMNALKAKHKVEMTELENKLKLEAEDKFRRIWQSKLETLEACVEESEKKVQLAEKNLYAAKNKIVELEKEKTKAWKGAVITIPPPPPPPPPPPLQPFNPLKSLLGLINSNKRGTSDDEKKPGIEKELMMQHQLIDEMMTKIKRGNLNLKPVKQESLSNGHSEQNAFDEMQEMLGTFRSRQNSLPGGVDSKPRSGPENELLAVLARRKQRTEGVNGNEASPDISPAKTGRSYTADSVLLKKSSPFLNKKETPKPTNGEKPIEKDTENDYDGENIYEKI